MTDPSHHSFVKLREAGVDKNGHPKHSPELHVVWSPWEDLPTTPAAAPKSSALLLLDEGVYKPMSPSCLIRGAVLPTTLHPQIPAMRMETTPKAPMRRWKAQVQVRVLTGSMVLISHIYPVAFTQPPGPWRLAPIWTPRTCTVTCCTRLTSVPLFSELTWELLIRMVSPCRLTNSAMFFGQA